MKKLTGSIASIMLSVMLVFGMFAGLSDLAYADTDVPEPVLSTAEQIADAASESDITGKLRIKEDRQNLVITEQNSINQKTDVFKYYEILKGEAYTKYPCKTYMPAAGTLMVQVGSDEGATYSVSAGGQYAGIYEYDTSKVYLYNVSSPGYVDIDVIVRESGRSGWMGVTYASADNTFIANTNVDYVLGSAGSSAESNFSVYVTSTGYLTIESVNGLNKEGSVYYRTSGFKNWDYRLGGAPITIGVKKGKYTISLKGAQYYGLRINFTNVKETSAKTSKKKAAKIKKGKVNKGIIVTDRKKVHWYKIKNPKNQKLKLDFNTVNMSDGGSGYIRITEVFPNGTKKYHTMNTDSSGTLQLFYGPIGTKKALKGTYYIKIESKGGANGYYTMKWK